MSLHKVVLILAHVSIHMHMHTSVHTQTWCVRLLQDAFQVLLGFSSLSRSAGHIYAVDSHLLYMGTKWFP